VEKVSLFSRFHFFIEPLRQSVLKVVCLVCTEFVDELPELEEIYSVNPTAKGKTISASEEIIATPQSLPPGSPDCSTAIFSTISDELTPRSVPRTPLLLYSSTQVVTSRTKRRRTNDSARSSSFHSLNPVDPGEVVEAQLCREKSRTIDESALLSDEDGIDSLLKAADFSNHSTNQTTNTINTRAQNSGQYFTSPGQEVTPETPGIWPHANVQEACLMRYFIDELACWVRPPLI
jgi:hypothetical protein